jgi:aryl-alcohol dehydrogenase-like predicted oxidoreductase
MEYVTLGRTGLKVSVAGLGCGGFSRLGLSTGKSEQEAIALVRQAMDLGVTCSTPPRYTAPKASSVRRSKTYLATAS